MWCKIISWVKSTPEICPCEARTKCTTRTPRWCGMARHCTRSFTRMQALQRFQSGCTVHTDPGHGASTAGTHSIHTCEPHVAPNSLNSALDRDGRRDIPKRRTMLQLLPHARCVIEAHRTDPFEPCGTAHTPLIDTIATSVSTASRTPVDCSRWFLVSN